MTKLTKNTKDLKDPVLQKQAVSARQARAIAKAKKELLKENRDINTKLKRESRLKKHQIKIDAQKTMARRLRTSASIKFGLREHILNGVNALADTIKVTLGPSGKLVMYPDYYNAVEAPDEYRPRINKDGYTSAKQIRLAHPVERLASTILLDASRINATAGAGDGCSSTTRNYF